MTTTTTIPSDAEIQSLVQELYSLRQQRALLDERMHRILGALPQGADSRPTWGPCTRCGNVWRGMWANLPPRSCPRCGSSGWRTPPKNKNARQPTDAPNPNWGKYKSRRRPRTVEAAAPTPIVIDSPRISVQVKGLTPPPRPEDVARTLVPPASVRFAEPAPEPQPESVVSASGTSSMAERDASTVEATGSIPVSRSTEEDYFEKDLEPDNGVPVHINEDGTITEEFEAVEGDGSLRDEEDSGQ